MKKIFIVAVMAVAGSAFAMTDADAKKLKKGMSFEAVKAVVGKPGSIQTDSSPACDSAGAGNTITWSMNAQKPGDQAYVITFCDGKMYDAKPR